jgi:hypothetical protein
MLQWYLRKTRFVIMVLIFFNHTLNVFLSYLNNSKRTFFFINVNEYFTFQIKTLIRSLQRRRQVFVYITQKHVAYLQYMYMYCL